MIVVCIRKDWDKGILYGKSYEVIDTMEYKGTFYYTLKDEYAINGLYETTNFKTIDEIRSERIDDILL